MSRLIHPNHEVPAKLMTFLSDTAVLYVQHNFRLNLDYRQLLKCRHVNMMNMVKFSAKHNYVDLSRVYPASGPK